MNLTRVALAVGLAWVVARLLLGSSRVGFVDADDGLAALSSVDTGLPVRVRAMTVPGRPVGLDSRSAGLARGT